MGSPARPSTWTPGSTAWGSRPLATLRREAPFLAGLLTCLVLCYLPGLSGPPVYDDQVGVLMNPKLTSLGRAAEGFLEPTTQVPLGVPFPSLIYRPLTEASFALHWALAPGLKSLRLGNLLIHATASVLVLLLVAALASRLGMAPFPAARWAALAFALHPAAVQSVTYVYQRFTSLEALLGFASLLLYLEARDRPGRSRAWWGSWVLALLAMGAKETAVTLPLVLAGTEWVLRRPEDRLRSALSRWLPFAALPLLVAFQILRVVPEHRRMAGEGLDFMNPSYGFHPLEYLVLQLPIVTSYLLLGLLPFPLRFYYDRVVPLPGQSVAYPPLATLGCAILLLALLGWILLGSARHRLPRLALVLFLAPLALESSVFPIMDVAFNHRIYPSLLGATLAFGWAAARLPAPRWAPAAAVLAWGMLCAGENATWARMDALQRRDVRHAFHVSTVWGNFAWRHMEEGRIAAAENIFRHAKRASWGDARIHSGHVYALMALGRLDEANRALREEIRIFPSHSSPLWLAIQLAEKSGDAKALDALARRAEALPVLRPDMLLWMARRDPRRGEALLERHLAYFPSQAPIWDALAGFAADRGDPEEAARRWRKALDLQPTLPGPRRGLAAQARARGDLALAERLLLEEIRLTDAPEARKALAGLRSPEAGGSLP